MKPDSFARLQILEKIQHRITTMTAIKIAAKNKPIMSPETESEVNAALAQFTNRNKWVDWGMDTLRKQGSMVLLYGPPGCLAGATTINCHRAGRGFQISIEKLVQKQNEARPGGTKFQSALCWDSNIPTYVARAKDGVVRLARLQNCWESGIKETFMLETETGRCIRATSEHPFLKVAGVWSKLGDLQIGDSVQVNVGQSKAGSIPKKRYRSRNTKFQCDSADEHIEHHDLSNNVLEQIGTEKIISIEKAGEIMTYDIEVADDPHCFLANGFVVHNTGKTMIAEYMSKRVGKGMVTLNMKDVGGKAPGHTERMVNEKFYEAKVGGNKTVFMDECEAVVWDRGRAGSDSMWMVGVIDEILMQCAKYPGLIVAATNREDIVDPALKDRCFAALQIGMPGEVERAKIWNQKIPTRFPLQLTATQCEKLAEFELVGRQIENAIVHEASNAIKQDRKPSFASLMKMAEKLA